MRRKPGAMGRAVAWNVIFSALVQRLKRQQFPQHLLQNRLTSLTIKGLVVLAQFEESFRQLHPEVVGVGLAPAFE